MLEVSRLFLSVILTKLYLIAVLAVDLKIQTERLQLFDKYLESFGYARSRYVLSVADSVVGLISSVLIVRLDGEYFLKGVSSAVSFERPTLHLT